MLLARMPAPLKPARHAFFTLTSDDPNAQQGRANADVCHVSCCRKSHDTLPWLISVSLGRMIPSSIANKSFEELNALGPYADSDSPVGERIGQNHGDQTLL